jgi:hypothetical protein
MIRLLVLVLVAANLFYFGWTQWITEQEPRLVAPSSVSAIASAPGVAAPPAPAPCTTVGTGHDQTRALEIEELLRGMQLLPERRDVAENVSEGWWVYVPNNSAVAQARTLRAIQRAGIRDAFAMADDPEFRVSVGLFMEEDGARTRAEAVRALQLDASVSERMQQRTAVWFDLPGTAREALDLAQLDAEGVDLQELRVEDCPAQAEVPADVAVPEDAAGPATVPQV